MIGPAGFMAGIKHADNTNQTLYDWLPLTRGEIVDSHPKLVKYLDCPVTTEFNLCETHPFKHKFVFNWCVIKCKNVAYAVGWNENPSIGWSFPMTKLFNIKDLMNG